MKSVLVESTSGIDSNRENDLAKVKKTLSEFFADKIGKIGEWKKTFDRNNDFTILEADLDTKDLGFFGKLLKKAYIKVTVPYNFEYGTNINLMYEFKNGGSNGAKLGQIDFSDDLKTVKTTELEF